jgi:histidinol-phosphate/aromatic aminotransferase/cobyric acid decarboxylase-like protein
MSTAISRRGFAKILSASAAYAALTPSMPMSAPVEVGRAFAALPDFMRVTIGTRPQMETFVSTFREVMS